jgi:hypothetical protein
MMTNGGSHRALNATLVCRLAQVARKPLGTEDDHGPEQKDDGLAEAHAEHERMVAGQAQRARPRRSVSPSHRTTGLVGGWGGSGSKSSGAEDGRFL